MSLFGVAGMIAPLVFTQVFAAAIAPGRAVKLPGAPYWMAALLMVGAFLLAWNVVRKGVALPHTELAKE
jgi:MFS transporter, DHA1 family, tetracycline resistance protein